MNTTVVIASSGVVDPVLLYGLSSDVSVIVVDEGSGTMQVNRSNASVVSLRDAPGDVFGRSSSLAYGALCAYKQGADEIIYLGDQCIPPRSFVQFYDKVFEEGAQHYLTCNRPWLNPLGSETYFARGFPLQYRSGYSQRLEPTDKHHIPKVHMGLSRGVMDLSCIDRLMSRSAATYPGVRMYAFTPKALIPISFENICFSRDAICLGFGIGPQGSPDILAGVIMQKVLKRGSLSCGRPIVRRLADSSSGRAWLDELKASHLADRLREIIPDPSSKQLKDRYVEVLTSILGANLQENERLVLEDSVERALKWVELLGP